MKRMRLTGLLVCLLLGAANAVLAVPDIQVNGLFPGQAALSINGKQRLLKVGKTSPEGVTLISSTSSQAVIEVDGQTLTLELSQQISSSYRAPAATEVRIPKGEGGHYYVGGNINGRSVRFLVDTGATQIAMNQFEAQRLGLDLNKGTPGAASTAGGVVETRKVILPKVTVGSITLYQVSAAVVLGPHPQQILLGNSFLSRVTINEELGVLVLSKIQ